VAGGSDGIVHAHASSTGGQVNAQVFDLGNGEWLVQGGMSTPIWG
jgi:hypothetical protein